jgi:RNA polymerase sigma-70 factor, ECF subfamily
MLPRLPGEAMSSKGFQAELVSYLPNLRAFAVSLCGNADLADDIVQEALLKAWSHLSSFTEGTNLRAWLFTILRNTYYSHLRRRRNDAAVSLDDDAALAVAHPPEQLPWMDTKDLAKALGELSPDQREAIILVGAEGFSYEETAEIMGTAVGTVKSRVNRARNRLLELLEPQPTAPLTAPSQIAGEATDGEAAHLDVGRSLLASSP